MDPVVIGDVYLSPKVFADSVLLLVSEGGLSAGPGTSTTPHIIHVVLVRTSLQVVWVYAPPEVTLMANDNASGIA